MDNGSQWALTLERMPQGGYVVKQGHLNPGDYTETCFASTTIDEALGFIRDKVKFIPAITSAERKT